MLTRVGFWMVPLVALLMAVVWFIPAEIWHQPANDAVYQGFDPNLIYVSKSGYAPSDGVVQVSPESLRLTALPNSRPTVHLVTSPLSFRTAMSIRILQSGEASTPLSIGIWSAKAGSGYVLTFGPAPDHLVTAQTVVNGVAAHTLVGGTVVKSETLGRYAPGRLYQLEISLNRNAGVIYSVLSSREAPPTGGAMVRLVGGPADPLYGEVTSKPIPVKAGREYRFGGLVKLVTGADAYKIVVQWLDTNKKPLGFANDWRSVQELHAWTRREYSAVAPSNAAFARVLLGSGNGTQIFFAQLFMREAGNPRDNLLSNGHLQNGTKGWEIVGKPSRPLDVLDPRSALLESSVTADEAPVLFESLRLSLTASSFAQAGITSAVLENYSLTLPHQRWQAVKVDDPWARRAVAALALLGTILCLTRVVGWPGKASPIVRGEPISVVLSSPSLGIAAVLCAYIIANVLLFQLGSLPFDMTSAKVWAYVAAQYGPAELYHLPHTVSLAKVWGGAPYHEAVFPYHPMMAYYFGLIGWLYRSFLGGPEPLAMDTFQLEFLIKNFNVIFGLADAVLIYVILRNLNVGQRPATISSGLFLLNPAVWFSMSVWGQNHVVTIFPLLLAIWMAETRRPILAWLALLTGALTRPQMLVPAGLLGLVFFRRFTLEENGHAIAWSIILVFLALAPFSLAISPSLPADVLAFQVFVQEAGGNEPALTIVSLDAYNLWALVSRLADGATGLARFQFPSGSNLIGALSYQRVSLVLILAVVLGTGLLLLRRGTAVEPAAYLPPLALATIGFLVLKTGIAATHFIIGLPFLILCRRALRPAAYYAIIGIWTLTTLVSMYGSLGFAIWNVPYLAPALHDSNNAATRLAMNLHAADWFISLAVTANALALGWLAAITLSRPARPKPGHEGSEDE